MPHLDLPQLRLEYEILPAQGDQNRGDVLLIHGLGCQMIQWPPALLNQLREAGYRLLRFDNRDVGLSTLQQAPRPQRHNPADLLRWRLGACLPAAYSLADMAGDALALMDAQGMQQAHVIGVSMGGMIAQELALSHPERVLSLCSIMSTSGQRGAGLPKRQVMQALTRPPPAKDEASLVDFLVGQWTMLQGGGYPTPAAELRPQVQACVRRSLNGAGFLRQSNAIMNAPNRVPRLRKLATPTLVLHGDDDPLVHVSGGKSVARAVPGAQLEIISGWGHDFPTAVIPRIGDRLLSHLAQAT